MSNWLDRSGTGRYSDNRYSDSRCSDKSEQRRKNEINIAGAG